MYRAPVSEISHTLMKVAGLEKHSKKTASRNSPPIWPLPFWKRQANLPPTVSSRCASPATRTALP